MNKLRDDTGTSLAELLIVCVLMMLVLSTAYMLFGAATTMASESEAHAIAADNVQHAMDTMTRELRQAAENEEGMGAIIVAQPSTVEFYMDTNHDDKPDKVRYYVSGTSIMRAVALATGSTAPYAHGSYGPGSQLLTGLVSSSDPLFCYHSTTVDSMTTCANGEQHGFGTVTTTNPLTTAPKIAMVGVDLTNEAVSGNRAVSVHTSALIRIRSVENVVK